LNRKILIAPSTFAKDDLAPLEKLQKWGAEIIMNPFGRKLTKEELVELLPGVTGMVAGLEPLNREVFLKSALRVISRCGAGLDNVDLQAANDLGIRVCSTPDAPTAAVAELTVGSMIILARRVLQMDQALHGGRWEKQVGFQLCGKSVLVIGFGRIGRAVARLVQPFGPRLLVVDPYLQGPVDGFRALSLGEALPQADVITIHASGREEILGDAEFSLMKRGVLFLNASRGDVIREASLVKALEQGVVAGAWIDTFSQEPYAGPLVRFPQVVLTPHIGSYSIQCRNRMEMEAVENLLAAFEE